MVRDVRVEVDQIQEVEWSRQVQVEVGIVEVEHKAVVEQVHKADEETLVLEGD
jgi:hypothetical protein